ncbi:unnamed protein product [Pedinophyceae sp. YPF-701]|nr:unnamed protein product [Pedinophyceae sp. YPF-701]
MSQKELPINGVDEPTEVDPDRRTTNSSRQLSSLTSQVFSQGTRNRNTQIVSGMSRKAMNAGKLHSIPDVAHQHSNHMHAAVVSSVYHPPSVVVDMSGRAEPVDAEKLASKHEPTSPGPVTITHEATHSHHHAPKLANPGPLGLFAFGMTTIMLMFADTAWSDARIVHKVLGYGFMYGGLTQWVAGILEFFKGNTFAATAFCSYGAFWIGWAFFGTMVLDDTTGFASTAEFKTGEALYLAQWGLFTFLLFIVTIKKNRCLQAIFLTLTLTFWLLAGGVFSEGCKKAAGYMGLLCGSCACYTAFGEVLLEEWDTLLPGL